MVWFLIKEKRKWMKVLGVVAFFLVVFQGVLGGLRVTLFKDEIGIFHGALAQLFLALIASFALFTSKWWMEGRGEKLPKVRSRLTPWMVGLCCLIFGQLVLGAMMRHAHVGLAVPDFPKAYGQWWPDTDEEALHEINQQRMDVVHDGNVFYDEHLTAYHIHTHMFHRLGAVLIFISLLAFSIHTFRTLGNRHVISRLAAFWFGLVCLQAGLGIMTVLYNKPADVATLHVVTGATLLVHGILSTISVRRMELQWLPSQSTSTSVADEEPSAQPATA
jgi:cytochrome c oxidase assembly protein subunit 15